MNELEKQFNVLILQQPLDMNVLKQIVTQRCFEIADMFDQFNLELIDYRNVIAFRDEYNLIRFRDFYVAVEKMRHSNTLIDRFVHIPKSTEEEFDEMWISLSTDDSIHVPYKFDYQLFWNDDKLSDKFSEFQDIIEKALQP